MGVKKGLKLVVPVKDDHKKKRSVQVIWQLNDGKLIR